MADRHSEDHQNVVVRSGCLCHRDIPPRRRAASTEFSEITNRRSVLNTCQMRSVGSGLNVCTHFDGGPGNTGTEESARRTSTSLNPEGAAEGEHHSLQSCRVADTVMLMSAAQSTPIPKGT